MTDYLSADTSRALISLNESKTATATEKLNRRISDKELQEIEAAAEDFEAVFLAEMLKPMFETVEVNSEFGGGKGEEVFRSFLVQEYGKIIAATGDVGIAEHVKRALIDIQAGVDGTSFAKQNITSKDED